MTETKTISLTLVRATTLDQFRTDKGKARMNQPYWIELDDAMLFQFIGSHTDRDVLEKAIYDGVVWVLG